MCCITYLFYINIDLEVIFFEKIDNFIYKVFRKRIIYLLCLVRRMILVLDLMNYFVIKRRIVYEV